MSEMPEKRRIGQAFGRAAPRYDTLADVQRQIADALVAQLPAALSGVAVDAGSGTGYLGRQLVQRHPGLCLVSCDLAPDMARRSPLPALAADLEALPLAAASVDLYLSSLAWQWTDTARATAEAARVLRPGGRLRVATLGPATLRELGQAFRQADDAEHVRRFADADALRAVLAHGPWRDLQIERRLFRVHAPTVRDLLDSVRGLGAGVLPARRPGLFGRHAWQRMEAAYETLREPAGLPLSYEALFISASRS